MKNCPNKKSLVKKKIRNNLKNQSEEFEDIEDLQIVEITNSTEEQEIINLGTKTLIAKRASYEYSYV